MTDTRLEAAARAAYGAGSCDGFDSCPPEQCWCRLQARAAVLAFLKAAREPSGEMLDAAYLAYEKAPEVMWKATVDQLIAEIE